MRIQTVNGCYKAITKPLASRGGRLRQPRSTLLAKVHTGQLDFDLSRPSAHKANLALGKSGGSARLDYSLHGSGQRLPCD
jgi:hypothetical protein